MANLLGLIVAVLLSLPAGVQAQEMVEPGRWWRVNTVSECKGWSAEEVAQCAFEAFNPSDRHGTGASWCDTGYLHPDDGPPEALPAGWWIRLMRDARPESGSCKGPQVWGSITWEPRCVDGSLVVGGMCAVPVCEAGQGGSAKVFTSSPPETFCSFGCTVRIGMCMRMSEDDPLSCVTTTTGASCTPTENDPGAGMPDEVEDETAASCMEQGKTVGEVNGVLVCVERGTPGGAETIDENTTSQETEVDGSVTKVDKTTTTITNIDGSVTVITTTVTTTGVGTPGESTSTEIDAFTGTRTQVCADRPNLPVCRSGGGGGGDGEGEDGGGEFAGSCASGFVCEGDPIQCAIAKEQHVRACQLFEDETDESLVYANALAGDDPGDAALDPANAREVGLEGVIDDGGFLAGSCLDDLVVPLWDGQSLTVPFSELCPHLEFMGMIVVAFSMLAAARIMFV